MAVFLRIHDANIHAMHMPGGEVYNMIDRVGIAAAELARLNVNSRTGKLRNSIRHNRPNQTGGFTLAGMVYANARHALWVHEGTGTIFPKNGRYLTVPSEAGSASGAQLRSAYIGAGGRKTHGAGAKPYFLAREISGQDANPYLRNGLRTAMARTPELRYTGNV